MPTILPSIDGLNETIAHYKQTIKLVENYRQHYISEIRKLNDTKSISIAQKQLETVNLRIKEATLYLNIYLKFLKLVKEFNKSNSIIDRKYLKLQHELRKERRTKLPLKQFF